MTPSRVDQNQPEIVAALRAAGCSVLHTHELGAGAPDIAVGRVVNGVPTTFLLEIKTATGKLTVAERMFHRAWQGHVAIVRSVEEALKEVGL